MASTQPGAGASARSRVAARLLPFLFLLYVANYLDRTNIAYATLGMKGVGLTDSVIGTAYGIFFIGYFALQIPGALLVERWSARLLLAITLITWGAFTTLTGFVRTPLQLYGARFLLGAAEAGFFPGVIVYLSHWFIYQDRAKAVARFMAAIPIGFMLGGPIAGSILRVHWLGIAGWRWLFLLEGVPAVIFGILCFFYLVDGPAQARWLSAAEKALLLARLDRERAAAEHAAGGRSVLRQLGHRNVVLMSIAYFGLISSLNTNGTWTPLIIREIAPGASFIMVGLLTAFPALLGAAAMLLWSQSSDRRDERAWHIRIGLLIAAAGWLLVAEAATPGVRYGGLILVSAGSFCALAVFWTLCGSLLSQAAGPAGMALINCVGIAGGSAITPFVVGVLKDWSGSFAPGVLFVAATLLLTIALVTLVAAHQRATAVALEAS